MAHAQANAWEYTYHSSDYTRSDAVDDDAYGAAVSEWEAEREDERLRQLEDRFA